jgi:hypothetical protein
MKGIPRVVLLAASCTLGWPCPGYARLLRGHYGFTFSGTVLNASGFTGPIAGEGDLFCQEGGELSGSETFDVVGTVCSGSLEGSCASTGHDTGTVTATFTPSTTGCPTGTLHISYTAVDSDRKFFFVQTDPDRVVSGVAERK